DVCSSDLAPFSINTLCPRERNPATPVGVTATRFSSVLISLGTPTIINSRYVKVYGESTRAKRTRSQDRELRMEDRESPSSILDLRSSNIRRRPFQQPATARQPRRGVANPKERPHRQWVLCH